MVNPNDHRDLKCEYCKRTLVKTGDPANQLYATRDHYIPKSKNRAGPHKLVWACRLCNEMKADKLPAQWERFMLRNPRWWEHPFVTGKPRAKPEPVAPLPLLHTRYILEYGKKAYKSWVAKGCPPPLFTLRPLRNDEPIPIEFEDPVKQAAFEAHYAGRRSMLRVPIEEESHT